MLAHNVALLILALPTSRAQPPPVAPTTTSPSVLATTSSLLTPLSSATSTSQTSPVAPTSRAQSPPVAPTSRAQPPPVAPTSRAQPPPVAPFFRSTPSPASPISRSLLACQATVFLLLRCPQWDLRSLGEQLLRMTTRDLRSLMTILHSMLPSWRSCSSGIAVLTHPLKHSVSSTSYPATYQLACRTTHLPSHYMNQPSSHPIYCPRCQPARIWLQQWLLQPSVTPFWSIRAHNGYHHQWQHRGKQASVNVGGACKVFEIAYHAKGSNVGR